APDEAAAAARLRDRAFHVVLIDLRLPGGDGGSVFRLVREGNPHARTVLITGHRAEMGGVIDRALAEGADAVCYKPFDVPSLLTTLSALSAGRADAGP
ncbi:MAG: response regulator, partial [Gemmataceae bacterium]